MWVIAIKVARKPHGATIFGVFCLRPLDGLKKNSLCFVPVLSFCNFVCSEKSCSYLKRKVPSVSPQFKLIAGFLWHCLFFFPFLSKRTNLLLCTHCVCVWNSRKASNERTAWWRIDKTKTFWCVAWKQNEHSLSCDIPNSDKTFSFSERTRYGPWNCYSYSIQRPQDGIPRGPSNGWQWEDNSGRWMNL